MNHAIHAIWHGVDGGSGNERRKDKLMSKSLYLGGVGALKLLLLDVGPKPMDHVGLGRSMEPEHLGQVGGELEFGGVVGNVPERAAREAERERPREQAGRGRGARGGEGGEREREGEGERGREREGGREGEQACVESERRWEWCTREARMSASFVCR